MINYNSESIISGHIKQLLNSFNLPTIPVAVDNIQLIKDNYYIYNNRIVSAKENVDTTQVPLSMDLFNDHVDYKWGKKINITTNLEYNLKSQNFTRNLIIRDTYYDNYTHGYLGDYLRFLRDYRNINLMPLYNCFSNEIVGVYKRKIKLEEPEHTDLIAEFNSDDPNHKIYKIPVRMFQNYTIAIESTAPVEIVCDLYGDNHEINIEDAVRDKLLRLTYKKFNSLRFNTPVIYDKLFDIKVGDLNSRVADDNLFSGHPNLYMFIKLPFRNNSSIVILEGSYSGANDFTLHNPFSLQSNNYTEFNFNRDEISSTEFINMSGISKLQLLAVNSGTSHPFSDRLVEYLVDNVITSADTIPDNITRIQKILNDNYEKSRESEFEINIPGIKFEDMLYPGIWNDRYKETLYSFAKYKGLLNVTYDVLGYCDKDVEKALGKDIDIYNNSETKSRYDEEKRKKVR